MCGVVDCQTSIVLSSTGPLITGYLAEHGGLGLSGAARFTAVIAAIAATWYALTVPETLQRGKKKKKKNGGGGKKGGNDSLQPLLEVEPAESNGDDVDNEKRRLEQQQHKDLDGGNNGHQVLEWRTDMSDHEGHSRSGGGSEKNNSEA